MDLAEQSQVVIPVGFGIESKFDDAAKQRIKDAGEALIRGDEGAANLLIWAAAPLVKIVAGQYVAGFGRNSTERDELTGLAQMGLVTAVRSLESRLRDGGHDLPAPTSIRAYLSLSILNYLRKNNPRRKRKIKAIDPWDQPIHHWLRDAVAEGYATQAQVDEHIQQLSALERGIYTARHDGVEWDDIAVTINKCRRQGQRILEQAKAVLIGGIIADRLMRPKKTGIIRSNVVTTARGPTMPTRKAGIGLAAFRRSNAA